MNNRTIDLKTVLFTLDQLQHTLDILKGAHQPAMQGNQPPASTAVEHAQSNSPLPIKSRA